jgi:tRNA A-37 threonylcarbamoyl transferase component Bud32
MAENGTPSERERRLEEVVLTYLKAVDAGQWPDPRDVIARHPDLADELRAFFTEQEHVNRLVEPVRPTQGLPAAAVPPSSPLPTFGDYVLLKEIARGGMGVVYKARQVSLNRIVALKMILSGQLASPLDVQRFHTEAENAARLEHPNIVPIYEVGECDGRHYFTMKRIKGGSLAKHIALFKDSTTIARFMAKVARAVDFAHERGILHRDLKPANILLDNRGTPHVTDFGLAKRFEGDPSLTGTGALVGTPCYMAPEQARAEKVLTTAVDVYGLGAILYELLTGRPPFRGETLFEVLRQVQEKEPERPRHLNPKVDPGLETVCLKCLQKDPAKRYRSASAVANDLDRCVAGKVPLARAAGLPERAAKWVRRRPLAAGLGAALALLVAVSLGLLLQAHEAQRTRDERDRVRKELEDELGLQMGQHKGAVEAVKQQLEDERKKTGEARREAVRAREETAQAREETAQAREEVRQLAELLAREQQAKEKEARDRRAAAERELRWRFQRGDSFKYLHKDHEEWDIGDFKTTSDLEFDWLWTVKEVDGKGIATIEATLAGLRVAIKGGARNVNVQYDSVKDQDAPAGNEKEVGYAHRLRRATFHLRLDPKGRVAEFHGIDKVIEPETGGLNAAASVATPLSDDTFAWYLQQALGELPEAGADDGAEWRLPVKRWLHGIGEVSGEMTFRLQPPRHPADPPFCRRLRVMGSHTLNLKLGPERLGQESLSGILKINTLEGAVFFDTKAKALHSSKLELEMGGEVDLQGKTPVKCKQVVTWERK